MTPIVAWTGKKPCINHLKVFGSIAVALDKSPRKGSKFQPKGKEYIKQYNILGALVSKDVPIPATFKEVMSSPYASEWRDAMQREYDSLLANQTWQIADLPRNQRIQR